MIITFKQMPTQITINGITGASPFNIYLCDTPTHCVYINTISTTQYVFNVPTIWSELTSFNLKVIDNNGCQSVTNLTI
jgi:hypothetical protein